MSVYTVKEFADLLGVKEFKLCTWIQNELIIPEKTKQGEIYFTDEHLSILLINYIIKPKYRTNSRLYIICESDKFQENKLVDDCIKLERKKYLNSSPLDEYSQLLCDKYCNLEVNLQINKLLSELIEIDYVIKDYVKNNLSLLVKTDYKYKKEFTCFELESIILNDKTNLTPELIKKFNNIAEELVQYYNEKNNFVKLNGLESHDIFIRQDYDFFKSHIEYEKDILNSDFGFDRILLNYINFSEVLYLSEILDRDNYCELKKYFENIELKSILQLVDNGYYHIFKFVNEPQYINMLSNYLKYNAFKNVYILGSESNKLPKWLISKCENYNQNKTIYYDTLSKDI